TGIYLRGSGPRPGPIYVDRLQRKRRAGIGRIRARTISGPSEVFAYFSTEPSFPENPSKQIQPNRNGEFSAMERRSRFSGVFIAFLQPNFLFDRPKNRTRRRFVRPQPVQRRRRQ